MRNKNILLIVLCLCSLTQSLRASFDYFPYFDNTIIVTAPLFSVKHIALYALGNGLNFIFQPKMAIYTLGLVGCLMSSKLLYSAISYEIKQLYINTINIDDRNLKKETKSSTTKTSNLDPKFQKCPYTKNYNHSE